MRALAADQGKAGAFARKVLYGSLSYSARRIGEIVAGARAITPDTGLRLSRFFAMSDGFWIGLQADFDREKVRATLAKTLARIKPWPEAVRARRSA